MPNKLSVTNASALQDIPKNTMMSRSSVEESAAVADDGSNRYVKSRVKVSA